MSLYWCVFAGRTELAGVEAGAYADFHALRQAIAAGLEGGSAGSRFPVLMLHSDCDGEWSATACARLQDELATIIAEMKGRPPLPFPGSWQQRVAAAAGLNPRNAFESWIDVDGEFLLQGLQRLAALAVERGQPILFQ
jgi:hypothetical protein